MPVLDITNFSTTAIKTSTGYFEMVGYEEEHEVVNRIGYLGDGSTKYDVDGANDADVRIGRINVRFKLLAPTAGVGTFNYRLAHLEALRGKVGRLTGKAYDVGTTYTYTCTARCVLVQTEGYAVHQSPPLVATRKPQGFINIRWELLSNWSYTSV